MNGEKNAYQRYVESRKKKAAEKFKEYERLGKIPLLYYPAYKYYKKTEPGKYKWEYEPSAFERFKKERYKEAKEKFTAYEKQGKIPIWYKAGYEQYKQQEKLIYPEKKPYVPKVSTLPKVEGYMWERPSVQFPISELSPSRGLQYTKEGQLIGPSPPGESYYKPTIRTPEQSIFRNLPNVPTPITQPKPEYQAYQAPAESAPINVKALAYLKEYVNQMRAAGFPDYFIREKLLKTGSVFIPDKLPTNFGQIGPWATGMADEFKQAMQSSKNEQGLIPEDVMNRWVPSPDEYLNYITGGTANRLPSYSEKIGYNQPTGKFSQAKLENLSRTLADYITNYQGKRAGFSQWTAEAGVAGYPENLAAQYYQEFLALAEQKAEEAKAQEEYEASLAEQQGIYKGELDRALEEAQSLLDSWQKVKSEPGGKLFTNIIDTDDKGVVTEYDPMDLIIGYIRNGESIENIANFIATNRIPITNYQLQGLYNLFTYGQ